jgi:hypothetical protein
VTVEDIGRLHAFIFPTPARLTAGTTSALVVTVTVATELNVGVASTNPAADGAALEGAPGTRRPRSGFDLTFKASFVP